MKHYFLTILISLVTAVSFAQADPLKDVFAFRINENIVKQDDHLLMVQIELISGGVGIVNGQEGILMPSNNSGVLDTSEMGKGKCIFITGAVYTFEIRLKEGKRLPKKGDLIYTEGFYPTNYKGQIYKLLLKDIYLEHLGGGGFYTFAFSVFGDRYQEASVIDSLVADIKYTGKEMLKLNPGQDRTIQIGTYKYKKLFTAMQEATAKEVVEFLDYVIFRPLRYAGNNWKISELFATWMDGGAPTAPK